MTLKHLLRFEIVHVRYTKSLFIIIQKQQNTVIQKLAAFWETYKLHRQITREFLRLIKILELLKWPRNQTPNKAKKKHIFKTVKKWLFQEDFLAETDEQEYITSLVFKVFRDNLEHIRNDAKSRRVEKGSENGGRFIELVQWYFSKCSHN